MPTTLFQALVSAIALFSLGGACAESNVPLESKAIHELVEKHYTAYGNKANPAIVLPQTTLESWQNCSSNGTECQNREQLTGMLNALQQAVPDLKWEVQDVMIADNKVIVRGRGSGTPVTDFMGQPPSGKSFSIMSIDIHTLENGKIRHTHHLEDWASALRQLHIK